MAHLIDKDAVLAIIEKELSYYKNLEDRGVLSEAGIAAYRVIRLLKSDIDSLEVKGVDLEKELKYYCNNYYNCDYPKQLEEDTCSEVMPHIVSAAKHFFELGLKVQKGEIWKVVDNVNHPQADRNKIYCVFTKQQYILATVINHPQDEDLLQWKCTEFPFHRYDMCEGDKYKVIN